MKIFEIILKLAFLAGSVYSIVTESVSHGFLLAYLATCLVLGIVLIFNKHESYSYAHPSKGVYITRRIEGVLLIVFSIFVFCVQG